MSKFINRIKERTALRASITTLNKEILKDGILLQGQLVKPLLVNGVDHRAVLIERIAVREELRTKLETRLAGLTKK